VGDVGDDASTGLWTHGDPVGTAAQPENDHSPAGSNCWFTGQGVVGGGLGDNDIDGGKTTLISPALDLSAGDAVISYWRWSSNTTGAEPNADVFVVDVRNGPAAPWVNVEVVGPAGDGTSGGWVQHEFVAGDFVAPTGAVQLRFVASDEGGGSLVEAAVDDLRITRLLCDAACQQDIGFGGPGSLGLSMCGQPLSTGNSATLAVTGAQAGSPVYLFASLTNNPTSFKGGNLVPVPVALAVQFTANGAGSVSALVPGGNGPFTVYLQAVTADGAQPQGYAISNALAVQFLP
jgi:hypothetical protein